MTRNSTHVHYIGNDSIDHVKVFLLRESPCLGMNFSHQPRLETSESSGRIVICFSQICFLLSTWSFWYQHATFCSVYRSSNAPVRPLLLQHCIFFLLFQDVVSSLCYLDFIKILHPFSHSFRPHTIMICRKTVVFFLSIGNYSFFPYMNVSSFPWGKLNDFRFQPS